MKEIWKVIEGFEKYQISNHGNVFSTHTGKLIKPSVNHKGYLIVQLCKDGNRVNKRIHRLVAQAFIPNPTELPEVDHKNRDRKDNHVNNLKWVTGSANTRNTSTCLNATSKYNGVRFHEKSGKWQVSVWFYGKTMHIGTFVEETKAALAFNEFCLKHKLRRELNIIEEV